MDKQNIIKIYIIINVSKLDNIALPSKELSQVITKKFFPSISACYY